MQVEGLQTDRLVLEPMAMTHSAGMFALWSDPDVCRWSGPIHDADGTVIPSPVTVPAQSDRIIDFWAKACADGWGVRWAITDRRSTAFLGAAGFNRLGPRAEYAYHLLPRFWHRGVMSEASRALFGWVQERGTIELEAFIDPANADSIAFAARNGFAATGTVVDGAARFVRLLTDDR